MADLNTEVIIVGGGTAGLAAAVAAAENGAQVTILEKGATTGGTGNMGMGIFAVESRFQKERKNKTTRSQAFKALMDYNHWKADARLAKKYIDKSSDTIDWLSSMGVKFADVLQTDEGAYPTCHTFAFPDGHTGPQSSSTMIKCLTVRAQQLGVNILLRTTAKKIIKTIEGVTGIVAINAADEEIKVFGKAVIIGCGGFGDNPEFIKKYTGFEWGKDMMSFRIPGCTGDGLRMAWEVGAAPSEMIMHMLYAAAGTMEETISRAELTITSRQPNLVVNLLGERFFDETMLDNNTFAGNAIACQKERTAFNIIDEETKEDYEKVGIDRIYGVLPLTKIPELSETIKQCEKDNKKIVHVADTLEDLAAKTGIKIGGLLQTVTEYNHACEIGQDDIFEKSAKLLKRPVRKPKFYAFRLLPSAYGTLGGIRINHKLEVLNKSYDVISGLYAIGGDTNNQYGDSYCFILPGHTMGYAVNSGRMAGENAAQYVKSSTKS
jgi:fumarate reductase flavoprotein subunit